MSRRSKIGLVLLVLFMIVNLAGGIYAAIMREPPHAALHFVLFFVGTYVAWRIASASRTSAARESASPTSGPTSGPRSHLTDRLSNLEQSVDAVAVEVERIGEGQRFMTRLFSDDGVPRDGRIASPVENGPAPASDTPRP
jgi:hypothetical protein